MAKKNNVPLVDTFDLVDTKSVWQVERYSPEQKEWEQVSPFFMSLRLAERAVHRIPSRVARQWYGKLEFYRIVEIRTQRIVVQVDEGAP